MKDLEQHGRSWQCLFNDDLWFSLNFEEYVNERGKKFFQNLLTFIKFGYAMLILTLLLMFWSVMVRSHETPVQYPPCFFNPLCTCSKAIPDLGIVSCYNVPMMRIPHLINSSKVFMLQLENNGLTSLQPQFLISTGNLVLYIDIHLVLRGAFLTLMKLPSLVDHVPTTFYKKQTYPVGYFPPSTKKSSTDIVIL